MGKLNVSGQSERVFEALLEAGENDIVSLHLGSLMSGHADYGFVIFWAHGPKSPRGERVASSASSGRCSITGAACRCEGRPA